MTTYAKYEAIREQPPRRDPDIDRDELRALLRAEIEEAEHKLMQAVLAEAIAESQPPADAAVSKNCFQRRACCMNCKYRSQKKPAVSSGFILCARQESNLRPFAPEANALSPELRALGPAL